MTETFKFLAEHPILSVVVLIVVLEGIAEIARGVRGR
jgi:hypothetical protein